MNAMLAFCAFMSFIYLPYDLFWKPVAQDQEVWFGIMLNGWAAKATEPLHWAIYAAGTWGFWRMRPWLHPWAALYVAQIGLGMLVWSVRDERGAGALGGLVSALPFALLAWLLWRSRARFGSAPVALPGE